MNRLLLLTVFTVIACHASAGEGTVLKPGDPVMITLEAPARDRSNVSRVYAVSRRGTVKLPMLDREIRAAGLTPPQLARRIETAYRAAGIFNRPAINAAVLTAEQSRKFAAHRKRLTYPRQWSAPKAIHLPATPRVQPDIHPLRLSEPEHLRLQRALNETTNKALLR